MAELLDELLERCRRGDEDAAAVLVRRFARYVLDLARVLLHDEHLAEDAMQAAFITALTRLDQLRTPAAFPGWLRQIVRREAVRILRARGCAADTDVTATIDGEPSPVERAMAAERAAIVGKAIAALPAAPRAAAELYYLEELKCDEVAERLGVPTGTVKRRLHDARVSLRNLLSTPPSKPTDSENRGLPL